MKEKFTKGSWKAVTHDGDVKHAVIYIPDGGFDISECPDAVANAHLIAAAPEMYEMLQGLYENACSVGDDSEWVDEIADVLKKARGES